MSHTAKHIVFTGRVQGVGFRFTANRIARRYRLSGWVRNLPDGTVEMAVQGPADAIAGCVRDIQDSFTGYIRKTTIEEVQPDVECDDFKITF